MAWERRCNGAAVPSRAPDRLNPCRRRVSARPRPDDGRSHRRGGLAAATGLYSFEVEPFTATFVTDGWPAAKRTTTGAGRGVLDEFNEQ